MSRFIEILNKFHKENFIKNLPDFLGEIKGALNADAAFTEGVPYAFQSEELEAPSVEDLVEIDLFALKTRIEEEEAEGDDVHAGDLTNAHSMADEMAAEAPKPAAPAAPEALQEDADEEIALTEEMLSELVEELVLPVLDVTALVINVV